MRRVGLVLAERVQRQRLGPLVDLAHHLVHVAEGQDGQQRAKNLFRHDGRVAGHLIEQRRRDVAARHVHLATGQGARALGHGVLQQPGNALGVTLVDHARQVAAGTLRLGRGTVTIGQHLPGTRPRSGL